jgi:hypothetical protein
MTTSPPHGPAQPLTPDAVESLVLDTTPWFSCDECFEQMDTYAEAVLRDPDHHDVGMERHLMGCAACREEAESLLELLASRPA